LTATSKVKRDNSGKEKIAKLEFEEASRREPEGGIQGRPGKKETERKQTGPKKEKSSRGDGSQFVEKRNHV